MDDVTLKIKSWWRSLTIWLAGAALALEGLSAVLPMVSMEAIDPSVRQWLHTLILLAIIYTRLFGTRQAVTVKAAMRPVVADKVVPDPTDKAGV